MASKKNIENQNDSKERLTKIQAKSVLRIRMVTQALRLFVPLFIKQYSETLTNEKKIKFYITSILDGINDMYFKHDCDPLSQKEVQIAVNSVLSFSKCPIIDWDGNPYVNISIEDAKRINGYLSMLQPLASEKEHLGISDINQTYFADIL